jgi:5-methylthioadenosine/S-adenosylhomocysteine deaminase
MKLASGTAPVPEFLKYGLSVGIGTDGCASNNNLDVFQEMDFMAKVHKARLLDPTVMGARQVLTMAARGGAEAVGLGDEIGSIEVGKRADVIIVDTRKPHLTPLYDPASHLVYAASGSDVRDVVVDGRWIVKDRALLTIDVADVTEKMTSLARQIAW